MSLSFSINKILGDGFIKSNMVDNKDLSGNKIVEKKNQTMASVYSQIPQIHINNSEINRNSFIINDNNNSFNESQFIYSKNYPLLINNNKQQSISFSLNSVVGQSSPKKLEMIDRKTLFNNNNDNMPSQEYFCRRDMYTSQIGLHNDVNNKYDIIMDDNKKAPYNERSYEITNYSLGSSTFTPFYLLPPSSSSTKRLLNEISNGEISLSSPLSSSSMSAKTSVENQFFKCSQCDKSYSNLTGLRMHSKTHTLPCKCEYCGKCFSRGWLLQGHIRTHTGEKPYGCTECGRRFADRSNLRAHLQVHRVNKRFICNLCGKSYSRAVILAKHMKYSCPKNKCPNKTITFPNKK